MNAGRVDFLPLVKCFRNNRLSVGIRGATCESCTKNTNRANDEKYDDFSGGDAYNICSEETVFFARIEK